MEKGFVAIDGMTCGACSSTVQRMLDSMEGISSANVSLMMNRAQVVFDPAKISLEEIIDEIDDLGFDCEELNLNGNANSFQLEVYEKDVAKVKEILFNNPCVSSLTFLPEHSRIDCEFRIPPNNLETTFGPRTAEEEIKKEGIYCSAVVEATEVQERKKRIEENQQKEANKWLVNLQFSAKFAIPLMLLHMVFIWIPGISSILMETWIQSLTVLDVVSCLLSTPVQYFCGRQFYIRAWHSLKSGSANMDVLVAIGTTAAYGFSWFALIVNLFCAHSSHHTTFETSASLLFVVSLGKWMETQSKGRTSEALTKLMDLQPPKARRFKEGQLEQTDVHLLQINDSIQVLRGEKIPLDGVVTAGKSSVNESLVTGESMPVSKEEGCEVIGGTVNLDNTLIIRVNKVGSETVLSKIVQLVENAQSSRAPVQAIADEIAQYFVPIVFLISFLTFILWYTFEKLNYVNAIPGQSDFVTSFMFAISVMVISCPCALGLATPTAVMVATGRAAELHILFKGGEVLEACGKATCVAFDKTGTLTQGTPTVHKTVIKKDINHIWSFLLSAEAESEHILGNAIANYCTDQGAELLGTKDFHAESGYGVSCVVESKHILVGKKTWMEKNAVCGIDEMMQDCIDLQDKGETVVWVAVDLEIVMLISLHDPIKEDAVEAIQWLKKKNMDVWMITGDNYRTALSVAKALDIDADHIRADVDPKNKKHVVQQLQNMQRFDNNSANLSSKHVVAFVGDGINDSPSLAQANVGIAIGSGTDVAIASAGIVIMHSKLLDIVIAFDLAKVALNRIYYNFVWALGYNVLMIPLAAGAAYPLTHVCMPPFVAGLCMAFSSISVVCSSLLLKRYQPPNIFPTGRKKPLKLFKNKKTEDYERLTMGNDDVQLDETEFHKTTNNVGIFGSKFRQSQYSQLSTDSERLDDVNLVIQPESPTQTLI